MDIAEPEIGKELFEMGWKQGVLFLAPNFKFAFNNVNDAGNVEIEIVQLEENDRLILVTQECDLISDQEEFVEALVCKIDQEKARTVGNNSSRYFVIDETNLVCYAKYRIQIKKEILKTFLPCRITMDENRLNRFRQWLGRRFTRPAIPDEIVDAFIKPLNKIIKNLSKNDLEILTQLSSELRLKLPEDKDPPYRVQLLYMVEDEILTEKQQKIIDKVTEKINEKIDPALVVNEDYRVESQYTLALSDYFGTVPLTLEDYTYKGDNILGIEPHKEGE